MVKIAVYINHPSQFYIFKNIIQHLRDGNFSYKLFIKQKDILEELLIRDNLPHEIISDNKKSNSIYGIIKNVVTKNKTFYRKLKVYKPDFLISCGSDVAQVGFLLGIPRFVLNDDDASIVPFSVFFGWPFATKIFAPEGCNMGYWGKKTIFYHGFQKLAYLHPKYFRPNLKILGKYGLIATKYFIIRSVSLTAHHDRNIRGLTNDHISTLIGIMSKYGRILITSENKLPENLESFKLEIDPLDIHHLIFYSSLVVGDSQSMAQEAALLGTPSIRFNDFKGRIGIMEKLEKTFQLTYGISPDEPHMLYEIVEKLASKTDKSDFQAKTKKMVVEMIDLPLFISWFIKSYPESKRIIEENPDYQKKFI